MVAVMPRKKTAGQEPGDEKAEETKEKVPSVKLPPHLHKRLSLIATWKGLTLKALVSSQLEQFAAQEWDAFQKAVKGA